MASSDSCVFDSNNRLIRVIH